MMARSEPSGERLQLHEGSTCGAAAILPLLMSNRNVSQASPLMTLYRQVVSGRPAHCTLNIPTSFKTKRGVPPSIGMAKMEENKVNLVGSWRTEVGDCETFGLGF